MESSSTESLSTVQTSEARFLSDQGFAIKAPVKRLLPQSVTLEIYDPSFTLRTSETLGDFEIVLRDRTIYSGHAVVRNLISTGSAVLCEVTLGQNLALGAEVAAGGFSRDQLLAWFGGFVNEWQKFYLVDPNYKTVIADLHTFFTDLRLWLEQVEMGIRSSPESERPRLEREIAGTLRRPVSAAISNMFERFESIANRIDEDLQPACRAFGQRHLHSQMLCAPFIYRTYAKPLGYAGDYEMMNMIVRNEFEGDTLYAKLVHAYMLDQAPAHAVRNRVDYLVQRIEEETARVSRSGRLASVYNIACGPAREVENFLARSPLADQARFRLLDFNQETLDYTNRRLEEIKRTHQRRTPVEMVKNSVHSLLKAKGRPRSHEQCYDLIYSSGLYDYLSDRVCKALNTCLYEQLSPGGLLVVGNFCTSNPIQRQMEHMLEWFLIYRDSRQLAAVAPEQASPEDCAVKSELTGTNIFLEVRKPA